jgi:HEPN domain-containing protein
MGKKPKNESIQDILDRIQEDIDIIRDKAEELENHDCDSDSDDFEDTDFEDDDSEEE